jgi:hypothetical protein
MSDLEQVLKRLENVAYDLERMKDEINRIRRWLNEEIRYEEIRYMEEEHLEIIGEDAPEEDIKFYEIEPGAKIYTVCADGSTYMTCHHLDGTYAYCETEKGSGMYLSVTTQLMKQEDGYIIQEDMENQLPPAE